MIRAEKLKVKLVVAHLNHKLRGAASDVVRGRVSGLSIDVLRERAAAANAE